MQVPGQRRDEPIVYLERWPEEAQGVFVTEPPCPACRRGFLVRQDDPQGKGALYTCTRGCGQRYWCDAR